MARNIARNMAGKLWLLAMLAMALVGCQTAKQPEVVQQTQVVQQEAPAQLVAEAGLSADERLRKVMQKLEVGEVPEARVELEAYLVDRPDSKIARDMLRQIDVPSDEYFPAESFNVRLTPGDSLSTLAQKYLGTYYQFYGLAKYNAIAKPSDIKVGQILRIPLTESARVARQKSASAGELLDLPAAVQNETQTVAPGVGQASSAAPGGWAAVTNLIAQNNYQAAVAAIEAMPTPPLKAPELAVAVRAYDGNGARLAATNPALASGQYLRSAQLSREAGKKVEAYQSARRSVQLDSKNTAANNLLQTLKVDLVDDYHKQASTAFRRQELDQAIALWDKVLEIDPNHQYAISYRLQAIELKQKLSNLQ